MKTIRVRIPEGEHFQNASDGVRLIILYERLLKLEAKINKLLKGKKK